MVKGMAASPFKDKTVMITGGTGSFGRAMASYLLDEDACAKVIIFSRDEWKQWEMQQISPLFTSPKIRYFLGSVRDAARLKLAMRGVDIVLHAAALKQVPAAEYNPSEFVQTNIMGAMHVIEASIYRDVEKVIALSTDKSVNPVNLYGATKLCSDKLFIAGNSYVGAKQQPKFSVVRYGNVLGSRGSILPFWRQLLASGARSLPVTDPEMTRFWITLDQAVSFVARCCGVMKGHEIFVPKNPTVKTLDLAEVLSPGIATETVGIREGEKLHESLISAEEARYTFEYPGYYMLLPPVFGVSLNERIDSYAEKGKQVPEGFAYTSDSNPERLTHEQLRSVLETLPDAQDQKAPPPKEGGR